MLISKELIVIPVKSNKKKGVIEALAKVAFQEGKINNTKRYMKAVIAREKEYSTAVGFNVAIPHGKTGAVNEPFFMYGRVDNVDWAALDGEPVTHVFLIGVPEKEAGNVHLQILAKLSRKLMKQAFRDELSHASNAEELILVLKQNELV